MKYRFAIISVFIINSAFSQRDSIVRLPMPAGPYKVGTVSYTWTDSLREETWTKDPKDFHRISVRISYPSEKRNAGKKLPYVSGYDQVQSSIVSFWGKEMPTIETNSFLELPLINKTNLPVIVFSHGMNSNNIFYTWIIEELVSFGFVVAAIEHPYWSPWTFYKDGEVISYEQTMSANDKLASQDIDRMMQGGIATMSADQNFVAQRLFSLNKAKLKGNRFYQKLDIKRLIVVGHSLGGMAAVRSVVNYSAFMACINYDGYDHFSGLFPTQSDKPYLLVLNSTWGIPKDSIKFVTTLKNFFTNPKVIIIKESKHSSFTDFPLTDNTYKQPGKLNGVELHKVILASSLNFLAENTGIKLPIPITEIFKAQSDRVETIDLNKLIKR